MTRAESISGARNSPQHLGVSQCRWATLEPITPHEKELALSALALLLEKRPHDKELRRMYREYLNAPILDEATS
jgi:hypothetical protein